MPKSKKVADLPVVDGMQAVTAAQWGAPLFVQQVERPRPSPTEVLVKTVAVSVHAGDWHVMSGRPYAIRAAVKHQHISGMDFSGVVEEVGAEVSGFAVGDAVFGTRDTELMGFADYVVAKTNLLTHKPANVSFEEAAAAPTSGMTALQALRVGGDVEPGDRVIINGASGGVGHFAVQMAKDAGAHVTAVCSSRNVEFVTKLGADEVIDYTKDELDKYGGGYNKVLDLVGTRKLNAWRKVMAPGGHYVAVSIGQSECAPCCLAAVVCFPCCCCCFASKKFHGFMQDPQRKYLDELATLMAEGRMKPAITKQLAGWAEVPGAVEALDPAATGISGKTVITVNPTGNSSQNDEE